MVKGLAKTGSACTMAERPSVLMQAPFRKGGYSPMTRRIIPISGERVVRRSKIRERDRKKRDESTASLG